MYKINHVNQLLWNYPAFWEEFKLFDSCALQHKIIQPLHSVGLKWIILKNSQRNIDNLGLGMGEGEGGEAVVLFRSNVSFFSFQKILIVMLIISNKKFDANIFVKLFFLRFGCQMNFLFVNYREYLLISKNQVGTCVVCYATK